MAIALRRALQHCRMFLPLAPAAHNLGVGLRRPCRGQMCGGTLRAVARIAPARVARIVYIATARPATPHSTNKFLFVFYS
jgi:hypothetical protein